MSRCQNHEQQKQDCLDFFKQGGIWKRLFTGFRNKYESYGHFSGKVVLNNLSFEDIDELEGFFGLNYHGKKSVTISAEKFVKALANSKYTNITPYEILTEYFDTPLIAKSESRTLKENNIKSIEFDFYDNFKETPAVQFLEEFENIVKNLSEDLIAWKHMLWLCAEIYNALPYRNKDKMYLAVFATRLTGNPHAFDQGTTKGNILYRVIQIDLKYRHINIEASEIFPAYRRKKSYLLAGIMIDDISNYTMLYNVHGIKTDGNIHQGIEGFYKEKNIVQLPLNVIADLDRIECIDNTIYIVENPSVFAMICKEKSCMCMNGQPRLAGLIVLELLAKSGISIYYSGDFDPEGILIAQKLSQFYDGKFIYWHMTPDDYYKCKSNKTISKKRMKILNKITDKNLIPAANAIQKYGMAGYQENIDFLL